MGCQTKQQPRGRRLSLVYTDCVAAVATVEFTTHVIPLKLKTRSAVIRASLATTLSIREFGHASILMKLWLWPKHLLTGLSIRTCTYLFGYLHYKRQTAIDNLIFVPQASFGKPDAKFHTIRKYNLPPKRTYPCDERLALRSLRPEA